MLQGKVLYKVRWKGYTADDDTWEPEIHLEDCKEVLLEFRKRLLSILQEILTLPTVPISLISFLVERLLHIIIDDNKRIQIVSNFLHC